MKISYNWLKQYIDVDHTPEELSKVLTNTGLEVESVEEFCSVKGGLKGCIIGEVKTKEKHPDADKLSITTVDIGHADLLHIVCGAPNVEAGQKVVVATVGTVLYTAKGELELKKAKIRGQLSEGMICAEDELGLGESHAGIMVLDPSVKVGTPASTYFNIEQDWVFEIGLTPNRSDAMSHIGVARDLAAALEIIYHKPYPIKKPDLSHFKIDNTLLPIQVEVTDSKACPRYAGITLTNVKVSDSPDWLKNYLLAVGLRPINNIVDITNFVLQETGQPLHAFDADKISGKKVIVKKLTEGAKFVTLDEVERSLQANDLMICNETEGMCMAGVFGGTKSGITENTHNIFIESAYFDPVHVRKTSKYHGLKTDASFRFERGVDPDGVVFALKRAALLIKENAGGSISSEIMDVYPTPIKGFPVSVTYTNINKLIGKTIDPVIIKKILLSLEIKITSETPNGLELLVPPFKADVQRECDIIEEILRIYGYNQIEEPEQIRISSSQTPKPDREKIKNNIFNYLSDCGFSEIMNNSLTNISNMEGFDAFKKEELVHILNPLSNELAIMRPSMLFGGMESLLHNLNRKIYNLKFYESGKIYKMKDASASDVVKKYEEKEQLSIFLTGNVTAENWHEGKGKPVSFYYLKAYIHSIFTKAGIDVASFKITEISNNLFVEGMEYSSKKASIVLFGKLSKTVLKKFDIKQDVYYAEIDWDKLIELSGKNNVTFKDIQKFPEVRRDIALLLDKKIKFSEIHDLSLKTEPKFLKEVNLFDIYEGKGIDEDKKSYAISFTLTDAEKTLTDAEIEGIMNKLINTFKEQLQASIR